MSVTRLPSCPVGSLKVVFALSTVVLLTTLCALLIGDDRTRGLAVNSLLLALGTCAISVPLGTVTALLLVRTDMPGRKAVMLGWTVLLFLPLYLQCAGWLAGFGQQGWATLMYGSLGTTPLLDSWRGAVWVHAMQATAWVTVIVAGGLRLAEPELEEQAMLDGATWQVFWHVTLRRCMAVMAIAALWVVVTTVGEISVTDFFRIDVYAKEIYARYYLGEIGAAADSSGSVVGGVVITAIVVSWLLAVAIWLCVVVAPHVVRASPRASVTFPLGRARWPAAAMVVLILMLVLCVPLGNMGYKAGVLVEQVGSDRVRSWSPAKFTRVLYECHWRYDREYFWSLLIASLSATAAVLIGVTLAWWARVSRIGAGVALGTTALCLATPSPVVGVALIWLLNRRDSFGLWWLYDQTICAPWAALVVRTLPLVMLIVWYAFRTVPSDVLANAEMEGAGPWARLRYIVLPQCIRPLACAFLAALAISLADAVTVAMVVPPGVDMLSSTIFGLLHAGVEDYVAGICLTNSVLVLIIGAITLQVGRVWRDL